MEKKRAIWLGVVLLVIAGGLSWELFCSREPMYDGKPLSFWLECYTAGNRTETSMQQADKALEAIGAKAVPTLISMIQKTDPRWKMKLIRLSRKQHLVKIKHVPAEEQISVAARGFAMIRGNGKEAVPALIRIFRKDVSETSQKAAVEALGDIGPAAKDAVPALTEALPKSKGQLAYAMVDTLGAIGPDARNAVPLLAQSLPGSKDQMPFLIVAALGDIHSKPEVAVPALSEHLKVSHFESRLFTLAALRRFGPDAREAVPAIIKMLKEDNQLPQIEEGHVRHEAFETLKQIDPEAAARTKAEMDAELRKKLDKARRVVK
ncbi:MAG TPA: hypothetical protein VHB20_18850 [Verrucomicrobiae bacterium]|nr:hypothetical protein [Verrucomicrobiae bacterium]